MARISNQKIIENNLNNVSNYLPNLDKKKIISNMWKNYGMTLVEYVFLNNFRKENSHVIIKDDADLSKISKNKKPVIFVSGHFANFELMSMEITKKNILLATIYRPLNNIFLNPFMEFLRKNMFVKIKLKKVYKVSVRL